MCFLFKSGNKNVMTSPQYICITLLKILKTCYFMLQIKDSFYSFFLFFLAKITLTLILPTLHTIWITSTNILYNMFIYPRIFRLPIKQLVFPIFPFLTSGSVHFWSGWKKNKMFLKNNGRGYSRPLGCLVHIGCLFGPYLIP